MSWLTPGPPLRVPAAGALASCRGLPLCASTKPTAAIHTHLLDSTSARRLSVTLTRGMWHVGLVIDDGKGEDGASSVVST